MSEWENVVVAPRFDGVTRAERRGGSYRRYHPDFIAEQDTVSLLSAHTLDLLSTVQARVAALGERLRQRPMRLLYSTLLRQEGISSSWMEGIRKPPRDVVVARLDEDLADPEALKVVKNVVVMEDIMTTLRKERWSSDTVHAICTALEPGRTTVGYRHGQVFVGGRPPLGAQYVAPPAERVPRYMEDLLAYVRHNPDGPLVKASITHAQFETIHPYEDGNGRTGRALFHGVLLRAGLIDAGVLPLSAVLRADVEGYVDALQRYRYDASTERSLATDQFVHRFTLYIADAVDIAQETIEAVEQIEARWQPLVARLRRDSAVHRALDLLPDQPVVTASFLRAQLQVSVPTAQTVLKELVDVGILAPSGGKYRKSALYQAPEVLALLERHVPGVQVSPPPEPRTPAARAQYGGRRCGKELPRKKARCSLAGGHRGPCRNSG